MLNKSYETNFSVYKTRRNELVKFIKEAFPQKRGFIVLFAGFENDRASFWQESSFYYYTGITEPGVVIMLDTEGPATLLVPCFGQRRAQWMYTPLPLIQDNADIVGFDEIAEMGDECGGYQIFPFSKLANYRHLIDRLKKVVRDSNALFTLCPDDESHYSDQRLVLGRLTSIITGLDQQCIDISALVSRMRRQKGMHEIDMLSCAIEITGLAHEAAARTIKNGALECEVQASLEYSMIGSGARPAFPSIVAAGKNATILHYTSRHSAMKKNDLVIVDIGALWQGYCADITRTYPVSGAFSKRQRELYEIVYDAQEYVIDIAKPGMYLNNADYPEQSLHHCAMRFLKKYECDQYFVHGIGHFLGLDVHDVGNVKEPLKEQDVFTIEPGIYIPEEGIGIRIEDDCMMTSKGAICLSDYLPRSCKAVEKMMRESF